MAWLLLIVAGVLEVVWATALKQSEGLSRVGPAVLAVSTALASLALLAVALERIPVGTGYAVWVGLGAAGVAGVGMIWHGDSVSFARLACLALILAGVIGLRMLEG